METRETSLSPAELERFGTVHNWSQELGISWPALERRMAGCQAITGRDYGGQVQINRYYPESEVRRRCADLLQPVPLLDEAGFYYEDAAGTRLGTQAAWARELHIPQQTMRRKLEGITGKEGRDKGNRLRLLYAEAEVRVACRAILTCPSQSDEDGFLQVEIGGESVRYAPVDVWCKHHGVSAHMLKKRLEYIQPLVGKDRVGRMCDFYAEHEVLTVISTYVEDAPQADANGFVMIDGKRHATLTRWADELLVKHETLCRRMKGLQGATARDSVGRSRDHAYFPEDIVRDRCLELIADVPTADASGFLLIRGERYAPLNVWCRTLAISREIARKRCASLESVQARDVTRRIFKFLAESKVRETCADLLPSPTDGNT